MEVMPGYKQTEVGVFPEAWDILPCSALSDVITVGIVIRPTQYYVKHGVSALRSANIREKGIDDSDMVFISEKSNAMLAKSQVRAGDILTVRTGYPGTSTVVTPVYAGSNCIDILITRPSKSVSSEYLAAWINSSFGKYQVLRNQGGLAQQHFNVGDLRNLVVALPPLPEQRSIAEVLSDADALIESLEQLISKKLQIKQGAMQELLQPKDGWVIKDLGDICTTSKERFDPMSSTTEIKCVELEHLSSKTGRLLGHQTTKGTLSQKAVFRKGDILFGKLRPYLRKFWRATFDGVCSTELWVIRAVTGIDAGWLYWLVQSDHIVNAANKSTGTKMPRAEWSTVKKTEVCVPKNESEQAAIAIILSDMDAEIAALEAKLAKTRQLKQGMMQELLTGRIRLV